MNKYYTQKLSDKRLEQCYDVAPERVRQYLNAEIEFVCERIKKNDTVLELGCGYGRVFPKLLTKAKAVFGIDYSFPSLEYGKQIIGADEKVHFFQMDAGELCFPNQTFNAVLCIQNGLSAFKVNRQKLIREAVRVTKSGGLIFLSTYAEKFWQHRIKWFEIQSAHDLIGEIDYDKTGEGVIMCKDGFRAETISIDEFAELSYSLKLSSEIIEIDDSSLFCIIRKI